MGGLVDLLRTRLAPILAIAAVVFGAVMVGWYLWPTKYTAVALVALDPQTPRLTADRDAPNFAGDASAVVSLAEVATSDGFLVALAQRQKLADDPEFADGADGAIGVAAELRRNLKVTRRGLSYLIDISFTSKDPEKAARVANAVAAEIVQRQQSLRKDASGGISDALRSRLADLRAAVLASEKAVADYRQANGLLESSTDGSLGLKRLSSLSDQLGPLRARLEDARARFDKLRKARSEEDADPSVFKSDHLSELLTRLGDEKRALAAAERTYGPRHPSVEAAQARIASIQDAVKAERARIVEQAKAEVDVLTEQNAAYESEIAKRTREQLATEQKQVVLQDLLRQAQADRQIYEQFLARQKATQEQSDLIQPEAVVVSSAEPPTKSNRPGMKLAALAGLLGGLGTGILWAMFGPRRAAPMDPIPAIVNDPIVAAETPIPTPPTPTPTPVPADAVVPEVQPDRAASVGPAPVPAAPVVVETPTVEASVVAPPEVATPVEVAPTVTETIAVAPSPADLVPESAVPAVPLPLRPVEVEAPPLAATPAVEPASLLPEPAVATGVEPASVAVAPLPDHPASALGEAEIADAPTRSIDQAVETPALALASAVSPAPPADAEPAPDHDHEAAVEPLAAAQVSPSAATPVPAAEEAAPVRVSARRHDPAQRLRRMLRHLTDHDVPLVADLTRPETPAEEALAPFATTLVTHLARSRGFAVSVVGVDGAAAPADVAERLANVVADHGYVVALHEPGLPTTTEPVDLVVEVLPTDAPVPAAGDHPFVLIVAEATREAEERLDPVLEIWEGDPDRVVVAAFAPVPASAEAV